MSVAIKYLHSSPGKPGEIVHPKGSGARILLSSVFGPYAQDDRFGSRLINPMELYHNQVTRAQGSFSPRKFHHSWGLLLIQENISAPCTVLDFPTHEAFINELRKNRYDIVGISSIIVNVGKVKEMCRLVREVSPHAEIIVGGHVAAIPGIEFILDADHIVKGDGIAWMRQYLGEKPEAPIRHPALSSGFNTRVMGVRIPEIFEPTATIIASVGCPMGCNFCTTSAFFGGKGSVLNFYATGKDLFRVMEEAEVSRKAQSFSIMDENFLLNKKRAMELLELMKKNGKSWALHIFSSANAIRQYSYEELVDLGISSIWLGLESPRANYKKLDGADTLQLSRELRQHGILTLGSSIIGLEHHTPDNIHEEIEHAVAHETDLHQYMLYTPVPGTALYREMAGQDRLLDVNLADIHGQSSFNFKHAAISGEDSKKYLDFAFHQDFVQNGPSLFRICRTLFHGWQRHHNHPDLRVRKRYALRESLLKYIYPPVLWAMEQRLKEINRPVTLRIRALRKELHQAFGPAAAVAARTLGPVLQWTSLREERRLARGATYEPRTFIKRRLFVESALRV